MPKIRANSKVKTWNIFASNGEKLGSFTFHTVEVKHYFPGATIRKQDIFLA